jgi:hypothetical protein
MALVVAEHVHDAEEGIYRLVVGESVEYEQIVTDENGDPVLDEETGAVKTEMVSEILPLEDIIFAADDKRWKNQTPDAIAASQRQIVMDALAARGTIDAPQQDPATLTPMPGVGESLTK